MTEAVTRERPRRKRPVRFPARRRRNFDLPEAEEDDTAIVGPGADKGE